MNNTPAEAREIVAQALESGEYTQGIGCLERRDEISGVTYCCLGVATREFMKCEQHSITTRRATIAGGTLFDDSSSHLPSEVKTWLGFATSSGDFDNNTSLADVNDQRHPFSKIAELFRNPPEGLLAQ